MSLLERALEKYRRQGDRPPPVGGALATDASAAAAGDARAADPRHLPCAPEVLELDMPALRRKGYLPAEEATAEMTHQYRRLKRPLVVNASKGETGSSVSPRTIAVASAIAGEGKSFTSLNLALSLAIERDFSVLLLDGDVGRSALSSALNLSQAPGLLDLLEDGARAPETCIRATNQPGLYFLPSGPWRDNAPELLGSTRLARLISDLNARFPACMLLCDTPPALLTNEARSFLSIAGQVVFVVSAGSTPRQSVVDALAMIEPDRALLMVLNRYAGPIHSGYQYYGDHYGLTADMGSAAKGDGP